MCIIIDSCAFASVFNPNAEDREEFYPVFDWIANDSGKIVYGGSKYRRELGKIPKYLKLLVELKRAGKIVEINDEAVDKHEKELEEKCNDRDFDDPHIIAIVIASGCRIICTNERRAIPFFKNIHFYPKGIKKPKIYTSSKNKRLLQDKDLYANICLPRAKESIELDRFYSN